MLVWMSFHTGNPVQPGDLTLANYTGTYTAAVTYQTMWNSIVYTFLSVALAITQAVILAWLIERTNMPFRSLAWVMLILPIGLPSILEAVAWILMLNPTNGIINVWIRDFVGFFGFEMSRGPFNIFTLWGMIWVNAIVGTSTFLLVVGAFRLMNQELEDAAHAAGGNNWVTFRKVTLRIMLPALSVAIVYKIASDFNDMDVPLLLGLQDQVFVLPTLVFFSALYALPPDWGLATGLSSPMILMAIGLSIVYYKFVVKQAQAQKFATVTGKRTESRRIDLGKWRVPTFGIFIVHFLIGTGMPMAVLLYASLLPSFRAFSWHAFSLMGFSAYTDLFHRFGFWQQITNSIILGVGNATITMALAFLISWVVIRSRARGRFLLDAAVFIPHILPGSIMGVALVFTYLHPAFSWIPIYGTVWIMVFGMATSGLVFSTRVMNGALSQIHAELEEAAAASGAARLTTLYRITLPLVMPAFITGWFFGFISGFRSVTIPLMLSTPSTETIGVLLFRLMERDGNFSGMAALGIMMVIFTGFVGILLRKAIENAFGGSRR
jgi:iron(III) transport system permease protein